jgi:anti-sigma B factor antagonist
VSAASYTITVVNGSAPLVVAVTGELDVTNASDFAESTENLPGTRPFVLDLTDLRYLDSAGFATLDRMTGTNSVVVVIPPTSPMFRAAALMDLPRHDTLDAAISAVGGS